MSELGLGIQVFISHKNGFLPPSYAVTATLVAGGGAGGNNGGGGGGAGGFLVRTSTLTKGISYPVIVGTGGIPNYGVAGGSGTYSSFNGFYAWGGGGGGSGYTSAEEAKGKNGGSGGGSHRSFGIGWGHVNEDDATEQGSAGGLGGPNDGYYPAVGGGGGGIHGDGANPYFDTSTLENRGGDGGASGTITCGSLFSISVCGGGAGGGTQEGGDADSGTGGGGGYGTVVGGNATPNTGSGGGGGGGGTGGDLSGTNAILGGNGSSGIVVLSYDGSPSATGGTIYDDSTGDTGKTYHVFTSSGSFKF